MTTKVEKSVLVDVPVSTAYNQCTQFEEFPRFMTGVESVRHLSNDRLEWVAEIMGVRRQWIAQVLEQVPDQRVSWAAIEGATNAGAVSFADAGAGRAEVHLSLEYEPEGFLEAIGDQLNIVERQAEGDLERFKEFVESEGYGSDATAATMDGSDQLAMESETAISPDVNAYGWASDNTDLEAGEAEPGQASPRRAV
ncbi:MAG: SRPBCC family protein [Micropruina sp.]